MMQIDLGYIEKLVRGLVVSGKSDTTELKLYLMPIAQQIEDWAEQNREWKALADKRLELLREGLEVTKHADGHWSDRARWMNWVDKVEKELGDG